MNHNIPDSNPTSSFWDICSVSTYVFLSEVNEVLEIDVVSIRPDVIVDEQVQLVFNPVLKDKRQDSRRQLQKEDDAQEHRELQQKEDRNGQWTNGHTLR